MNRLIDWLNWLSTDADPAKTGFQYHDRLSYMLCCVFGPVLFGALVGGSIVAVEKVFGIKLSSRGGH